MEKYIFLDIDGVIATPKTVKDGMWALTPIKQFYLDQILKHTDAKIVLSSSWRCTTLEDTVKFMNDNNFLFSDKIVGVTLRAYHYILKGIHLSMPRGVEIKQWLDVNVIYPWIGDPEKTKEFEIRDKEGKFIKMNSRKIGIDYNYVIIDDDSDMLFEHRNRFVKTHPLKGLSLIDTLKAIRILLPNKNKKTTLLNLLNLLNPKYIKIVYNVLFDAFLYRCFDNWK